MTSEEIVITGGRPCSGSIQISGAKNAALPLMASCMLTDKPVTLHNVPQISDIEFMKKQYILITLVWCNSYRQRFDINVTSE